INARYNLARALAGTGDLAGAETEFKRLISSKPDDVDGLTGLSAVYIAQKRYREAVPLLQEASRLTPGNPEIKTNLGTALAITGDLKAAVREFQEALKLDPGAKTAAENLARAQAALAAKE
ncbi:MAG: tetratricopeptide repeat protein, partial [Acidobacteriaceae bacterium]|nr:tetratricopeptide repeat protein [Acidobacteriaceae bacterium]